MICTRCRKKRGRNRKTKLDNIEKKFSILERASKLAKDGLIQQDGDLHVQINDSLFLANGTSGLLVEEINKIPEIEAKEERRKLMTRVKKRQFNFLIEE